MDKIKVDCIYGKTNDKTVFAAVPGSKSITNRALLLAALADGESELTAAFLGGDFYDLAGALEKLGISVSVDKESRRVSIKGCNGKIQNTDETIYVGNAGTAARFVTALLGCVPGTWKLDASPQMRRRPMAPLLDALGQMGCSVKCTEEEGHFPFVLTVPEKRNTEITIDINSSSQFLSALLIAGTVADGGLNIKVCGKHGMAYVEMTERMIRQFGLAIEPINGDTYVLHGGQKFKGMQYAVEPDMSAACYFYAAAAVLGIKAGVCGVVKPSLQGDMQFLDVLEKMGCCITETADGIVVNGQADGKLGGISVDMHSFSDQALTLAAIAPYADSEVRILNVAHIRGQECDRIDAIEKNLTRLGVECHVQDGDITIKPGKALGTELETYGDHRVAMSFAVTGLRTDGIVIQDPACTKKTFEGYFDVLKKFTDELVID